MRTADHGNLREQRAGWRQALRVGGACLAIGVFGNIIDPTRAIAGNIAGPVIDVGSTGDIVGAAAVAPVLYSCARRGHGCGSFAKRQVRGTVRHMVQCWKRRSRARPAAGT